MKTLPYFRWFPKDAEGDGTYRCMTMEERGLYHTALNISWLNDGLPADEEELSRMLMVPREVVARCWGRVSLRFVSAEDGKLRDPHQEEERARALAKSEHNKRVGNANAKRTRSKREPIDTPRAYESESVYVSEVEIPEKQKEPIPFPTQSRFLEWLDGFNGRKADEDSACRAWISVDGDSAGDAPFACRDRYNASREVADGKCMEAANFIFQQARNKWKGNWPKARDPSPKRLSATEEARLLIRKEMEGNVSA